MNVGPLEVHRRRADAIRAELTGDEGLTDAGLRGAVMARAGGGPAVPEPFDALAGQIGTAAYDVTDAQIAAVRTATGSDKRAFEIVLSAAIGAGLTRWDAAARAIDEASNASA